MTLNIYDSWYSFVIAAVVGLSACSNELGAAPRDEQAVAAGTVRLPLSTTVDGTTYRLSGQFDLRTYPAFSYLMSLKRDSDEDTWTATIQPGRYYLDVLNPQLSKIQGDQEEPVAAKLSNNLYEITVNENETTTVTLTFVVDGVQAPLSRGEVELCFEVRESVHAGEPCEQTEDCSSGLECVLFMPYGRRCAQPCSSDADCTLGGACRPGNSAATSNATNACF